MTRTTTQGLLLGLLVSAILVGGGFALWEHQEAQTRATYKLRTLWDR